MSEAQALETSELPELLPWAEICRRYPDQWVALVDMDWIDDTDEFTAARIAGHGPKRADPLAQARRFHSRFDEIGHFFTGRVRALDLAFVAP